MAGADFPWSGKDEACPAIGDDADFTPVAPAVPVKGSSDCWAVGVSGAVPASPVRLPARLCRLRIPAKPAKIENRAKRARYALALQIRRRTAWRWAWRLNVAPSCDRIKRGIHDRKLTAGAVPRRGIWGWMLFDWAAQPFFTRGHHLHLRPVFRVAHGRAIPPPDRRWGYGIAAAGLVIAILSPVLRLHRRPDRRKKPWIVLLRGRSRSSA